MSTPRLFALGLSLCSLLALGCDDKVSAEEEDSAAPAVPDDPDADLQDNDGDGWSEASGDCDDSNADLYPGRAEDCDGIDNNCNNVIDEGFPDTDYDDIADCMDEEECDGLDNDGDGEIDEGWEDLDGDGVIDCDSVEICDGIDNDGDGEIDEGFDEDGDGYSGCDPDGEGAEDCDDNDASVSPGTAEADGDLVDNDCDGLIDEGLWAEGDLVITEVMNNPAAVNDPEGEWFELWNASGRTLVLNGIILSSTVDDDWHQVRADAPLILEPGDHFVMGTNEDMATNGHLLVDYPYDHEDLGLSNESDGLVVEADGVTVDLIEWDDGATFPDPAGASMSLDPVYMDATLNDTGDYWCNGKAVWADEYAIADRGSPGEDNPYCWPTAVASYDSSSSLDSCDTLYLDGSGSFDSAGLTLTYEWELTSAPSGSALDTSDIEETDDQNPIFVPDVAGTYTFTLTVYNGEEYSQPSSVSVTISERAYNTDPVADAGEDETYSDSVTCQPISYGVSYECDACSDYDFELDGSASYDPDGDELHSPTWTIVSGSSSASITDDDTWEPTVTVTSGEPTYGSTDTTTVEVQLEVTDCMGATATDIIALNLECTGS